MSLSITVKHKDGAEVRTRITAATEVAFEAHFSKSWSEAFTEEHPRNTYIYFVTWHSIHDDGRTPLTFEQWLRTLESYEVEAEPLDPSPPVAPPGSSVLSQ
jgi:hypothetical protein